MNRVLLLTVQEADAGRSLETFLKRRLWVSHSLLVRLKAECGVSVDGAPCYMNVRLQPGQRVRIEIPMGRSEAAAPAEALTPQNLSVPMLYEDPDFCVYDKPAGLPVHPSYCHPDRTLANQFLYDHPDSLCRTVTRLDAGTSGCVLMAKNMLSGAVNRGDLTRIYYGVTAAPVSFTRMRMDAPMEREQPGSQRRIVRPDGKPAVTHIRKIGTFGAFTLLRFRLETGRTHQIRVHCAALGIPLCGDALYGGDCGALGRPALHAAYLSLKSNVTGGRIGVRAPLPQDIRQLILPLDSVL